MVSDQKGIQFTITLPSLVSPVFHISTLVWEALWRGGVSNAEWTVQQEATMCVSASLIVPLNTHTVQVFYETLKPEAIRFFVKGKKALTSDT